MPSELRYVIYGAGAIGGTIGGRLQQHGNDVVLVARGTHYEALRDRGLRLADPQASAVLDVPVVEQPSELTLTDDDVVVLAMKTQDTEPALRELAAVAPPGIAVVCAQNGVENERLTLRRFADVYAMCVILPATHLQPGEVLAASAPVTGLLDLGRYPAGVDDRARQIAADLSGATFRSEATPTIMRQKWAKLRTNLANAIEAVADPPDRRGPLYDRVLAEADACLAAAGIDVAAPTEGRDRRRLVQLAPVEGQPWGGGSSWQSIVRGVGSIEADYLNGEIVLLGRLHGIPTPANALLQRVANDAARDRRPPGSIPVDDLLAELG